MSAPDAVQAARTELASALAASQQLLDAHGQHPGYRTSAEWLTVVARNARDVNSVARQYLEITSADAPPPGTSRKAP